MLFICDSSDLVDFDCRSRPYSDSNCKQKFLEYIVYEIRRTTWLSCRGPFAQRCVPRRYFVAFWQNSLCLWKRPSTFDRCGIFCACHVLCEIHVSIWFKTPPPPVVPTVYGCESPELPRWNLADEIIKQILWKNSPRLYEPMQSWT